MLNILSRSLFGIGKWFTGEFDKLLLTFLFMWVVRRVVTSAPDTSGALWARELAGTIVGSLITLVTGQVFTNRLKTEAIGGSGPNAHLTATSEVSS